MGATNANAGEPVDTLHLDGGTIGWPASGVVTAPTQAYLLERDEWIDVEITVRRINTAPALA